jgi:hypothetical protein
VTVDPLEVLGPVAVVAGVAGRRINPLVGHRRREPKRGGTQAADVVQALAQAAQVAAAVVRAARRVVFAGALVVVARVTVGKAVGEHEIDDLVAPVGRGHVQPAGRSRGQAGAQGTGHQAGGKAERHRRASGVSIASVVRPHQNVM